MDRKKSKKRKSDLEALPLRPKHCFCQIPENELEHWAHERYHNHHSTTELMNSTNDPHDREVIGIVALLDVPDDAMLEMMGDVNLPDHHIIHCRERVKKMIEENAQNSTQRRESGKNIQS